MTRFNNNKIVIAASVLVLISCVGFVAAIAPLVGSTSSTSTNQERVADFVISESRDSASWTAFGREWIVDLELSDVVEDNTDYFLGSLRGDASAAVSFALLPGSGLSGMIATGTTTYWIRAQPVVENDFSEEERDLGIFMVRDQQQMGGNFVPPAFGEPLIELNDEIVDAFDIPTTKRSTVSSYKVGILFDQKWASTNNPWASRADTLALFNDVNAIYRAAGLGTFSTVYLKQITNDETTLNDMLNYFSDTATKSIAAATDTSYTNYIWLVGTNVGGLAWVGTSCKGTDAKQNRKTAVAGLVSYSRLWTVKTIAHELAHNRGASHLFTNACTSTLKTDCQCSVMSYCFPTSSNNPNGATNFFDETSIDQMKNAGCY